MITTGVRGIAAGRVLDVGRLPLEVVPPCALLVSDAVVLLAEGLGDAVRDPVALGVGDGAGSHDFWQYISQ